MTVVVSAAHNNYRLLGTLAHLDLGAGAARIQVFTAPRPTFGGTAGVLLIDQLLLKPSGSILGDALVLSPGANSVALNTGVAAWARFLNGNGDVSADADVTNLSGGGDVKLSSVNVVAGRTISVWSAVLR